MTAIDVNVFMYIRQWETVFRPELATVIYPEQSSLQALKDSSRLHHGTTTNMRTIFTAIDSKLHSVFVPLESWALEINTNIIMESKRAIQAFVNVIVAYHGLAVFSLCSVAAPLLGSTELPDFPPIL